MKYIILSILIFALKFTSPSHAREIDTPLDKDLIKEIKELISETENNESEYVCNTKDIEALIQVTLESIVEKRPLFIYSRLAMALGSKAAFFRRGLNEYTEYNYNADFLLTYIDKINVGWKDEMLKTADFVENNLQALHREISSITKYEISQLTNSEIVDLDTQNFDIDTGGQSSASGTLKVLLKDKAGRHHRLHYRDIVNVDGCWGVYAQSDTAIKFNYDSGL